MNKLIVVTGGTKGIGKAVIEKFASDGFDVATCARNQHDLETLEREFSEKYRECKVSIVRADMAVKEEVTSFCDFVQALHRDVDVLVNNAGYFIPGEIVTEPEGTLESMINANLYSAYYMTRGIVPAMKLKKAGHIFNICSIASIKAYPNGGSYAISKSAMLGFSRCLREELKADNIRVTAVMPGATLTASWAGTDLPDERFMKVEDIAKTIHGAYHLSGHSVVEEIIIRPQLGDI
ncbi:MAG TPA: SDR family oxidoreductase [Ohtaekwangia sp.]|nr:SDR family oxidoreductase [Ohtaekwangia sp.]